VKKAKLAKNNFSDSEYRTVVDLSFRAEFILKMTKKKLGINSCNFVSLLVFRVIINFKTI
jgi:hypothetical protein